MRIVVECPECQSGDVERGQAFALNKLASTGYAIWFCGNCGWMKEMEDVQQGDTTEVSGIEDKKEST